MRSKLSRRWFMYFLVGMLAVAAYSMANGQSTPAKYLQQFEKETTVKVLPNGLTLIICERPEAPVFSYPHLWMRAT